MKKKRLVQILALALAFLLAGGAVVTALISREEYHATRGEQIVDRDFGGSLPAFVAAFTKRRSLSAAEVAALRALVDAYEGK